ncbi:hypothetical protein KT71_000799 [Congregibacter litoralis KT71]|uniref:Uncharacterized protein n=1 Tax=Congregibacter litoralis KT71 TaxID=314285 RepID=V7HVL1_9GAMM|nr:hypothetical protein KT71_000799 [Congregibacter litoralis KT71]
MLDELDEELLDDDELDEELDEELEEELLGGGAGVLGVGMEGVCGVVGLLAVGQPLSIRQASRDANGSLPARTRVKQAVFGPCFHSSFGPCGPCCSPCGSIISPAQSLCFYRQAIVYTWPERRSSQAIDNVARLFVVVHVVIETNDIHDPSALGNPEF